MKIFHIKTSTRQTFFKKESRLRDSKNDDKGNKTFCIIRTNCHHINKTTYTVQAL